MNETDDLTEAQKKIDEERELIKDEWIGDNEPDCPADFEKIKEPEEFKDSGVFCCDCNSFYWYTDITLKGGKKAMTYYCPKGHIIGTKK